MFALLAVGATSFGLVQAMTIPVLSALQHHYRTDLGTASWVLTTYLVSASVATPIIGRLGDSFGRKRCLVATLLLLSAGSALAALAPNIQLLLAARVVQGFAGGLMPLSFGIVRDTFPAERVARAVSVLSSLIAVGMAAGTVLGGPVIDLLGVPWLFWLPGLVTAVAAALVVRWLPRSEATGAARPGVVPPLLMALALVALLLGVTQAPRHGWTSPAILGLLAASVVLTAGWVRAELRARSPFIDMAMMRRRPIWAANLVALVLGGGMFASYAFSPQFMQTDPAGGFGLGATVTESGLMVLPTAVVFGFSGWLASLLEVRIGARATLILGSCLSAAGTFWFVLAHDRVWEVVVSFAVAGLGIGVAFAALAVVVVASVPPEQTGAASGMNTNIRNVGGAFGTALTASVLTATALTDGRSTEAGYLISFFVLGVLFLLAIPATLAIPRVGGAHRAGGVS
ncbi:MFS transporter [Nocardioides albidus]|uniref:MFS transporter n=1 Tax=Nocardioides albidus TaxID=1517589 RepID=A0A5C4VM54_9ACTN|nr:MFS transporter [Nocardioides albidus]TNM36526.1 MFS transporter [Nocardioides albidus]